MSVHRANLMRVINDAWVRTRKGAKEEGDKRVQNANRSENWMRELAGGFASEYRDEARHRIFW